MTTSDLAYRQLRDALRTPARWVLAHAERRGVTFTVRGDRIMARPAGIVTAAERTILAEHKPAAVLLITRRGEWSEWALREVPPFDATRAFLTPAEIRGETA